MIGINLIPFSNVSVIEIFSKNHKKGIFYLYLTKIAFIIISFLKGILGLFLGLFKKNFKELGLSHLIVAFWLIKNFFENDFIKLCQK